MQHNANSNGFAKGGNTRGADVPLEPFVDGHAKPAEPAIPTPADAAPAPPATEAEVDPTEIFMKGRDPCGRFVKGNVGGPGNPFARKVAALRSALLEAITPERMRALAERLHRGAMKGDMAAAALLLRYTLGTPAPAVDPDRLELEAFRLLRESPGLLDTFAVTSDFLVAPALAAKIAAGNLPVTVDGLVEKMREQQQQRRNK